VDFYVFFFFIDSVLISLIFVGRHGFLRFFVFCGFGMDVCGFVRFGIDSFAFCWMALVPVLLFADSAWIPWFLFVDVGVDVFAFCWMALISMFFVVDLVLIPVVFFCRFGIDSFAVFWIALISVCVFFLFCKFGMDFSVLFGTCGMDFFAFYWMA